MKILESLEELKQKINLCFLVSVALFTSEILKVCFFFSHNNFYSSWGITVLQCGSVSAVVQCESAIGIYMLPPS